MKLNLDYIIMNNRLSSFDKLYCITYESGDYRDKIPTDEIEMFDTEIEYIRRLRELENGWEVSNNLHKWIINLNGDMIE